MQKEYNRVVNFQVEPKMWYTLATLLEWFLVSSFYLTFWISGGLLLRATKVILTYLSRNGHCWKVWKIPLSHSFHSFFPFGNRTLSFTSAIVLTATYRVSYLAASIGYDAKFRSVECTKECHMEIMDHSHIFLASGKNYGNL